MATSMTEAERNPQPPTLRLIPPQIGRMEETYRRVPDEELMQSYQQWSTVLKSFLYGD